MSQPLNVPRYTPYDLVARGFDLFVANLGPFLGAAVILLLVSQVAPIIGQILAGPLWVGMCLVSIKVWRGVPLRFDDFFGGFREDYVKSSFIYGFIFMMITVGSMAIALPVLFMSIIVGAIDSVPMLVVCVVVGSLIALLPSVLFMALCSATPFFLIDGEKDLLRAMQSSIRMARSAGPYWAALWGWLTLVHLLGFICCIGIFLVVPWMCLALAGAYDTLRPQAEPPPVPLHNAPFD